MYKECRHIKATGVRCGTPAIQDSHFCYHHSKTHSIGAEPNLKYGAVQLPPPEDAASMLLAVARIQDAILNGRMPLKTATALLYSLQIIAPLVDRKSSIDRNTAVQSVEHTALGDEIAPLSFQCDDEDHCDTCPYSGLCSRFSGDPATIPPPAEEADEQPRSQREQQAALTASAEPAADPTSDRAPHSNSQPRGDKGARKDTAKERFDSNPKHDSETVSAKTKKKARKHKPSAPLAPPVRNHPPSKPPVAVSGIDLLRQCAAKKLAELKAAGITLPIIPPATPEGAGAFTPLNE